MAQGPNVGLRGTGAPGNGGLWPVGLGPWAKAESQIVYFFSDYITFFSEQKYLESTAWTSRAETRITPHAVESKNRISDFLI